MAAHDDNGGGWGVLAGSTIVLTEIFALAPGLLPLLLLTGVFALPFVLPLIPLALLAGIYLLVRKVARALARAMGGSASSSAPPSSAIPAAGR
jgi:hypothetical protein